MKDRRPAVVGAVLAGGRGRRLGGAKATAELGGRPLISYPLEAAADAGLEPLVIAKAASPLPPLGVPVEREPDRPVHPLAGIVRALAVADGRPVVAIACDMPFVTAELLAWLAARSGTSVPELDGELEPLLARYDPTDAPALEAALERNAPLREAVAELDPTIVGEDQLARFGNPRRLCFNVNSPADLERAELDPARP